VKEWNLRDVSVFQWRILHVLLALVKSAFFPRLLHLHQLLLFKLLRFGDPQKSEIRNQKSEIRNQNLMLGYMNGATTMAPTSYTTG